MFQEFEDLDDFEVANLLRLAVELATDADLEHSLWLTLQAHNFYGSVDTGLAANDLPELTERLGSFRGTPLAGIDDTLTCLDAAIDSLEESRRETGAVAALTAVANWTFYSNGLGFQAIGISDFTIMNRWVTERAEAVINSPTASYKLRLEAYWSSCAVVTSEAHHRLTMGLIDVSRVPSWHERAISEIPMPSMTDSQIRFTPQSIVRTNEISMRSKCANWLMENRCPAAALEHFSRLGWHVSNREEILILASIYSSLGLLRQTMREIEGLQAEGPSDTWMLGRIYYEVGDARGLNYLRSAVGLP